MRLFVAGLTAVLLAGCGGEEGPAPVRPPAATGERFTVRLSPVADVKMVAATVETRDQAEARARIGGTLAVLTVRAGDTVRKGQVIGRVVDPRLGFATDGASAQVSAATAEAARAESELARTQYLYDNGVYAKARLEQVQAAARAAQGALSAARAQRSASAELSGQGAIVAPSDGRVLKADVPAGSVVGQGQSVATLTAGPPVLRLEIPEADGRALQAGAEVSVAAGDLPGVDKATVAQVYPAVTGGRLTVDATAPGLRADRVGQRVRIGLPLGQRKALVVPARFVAHRYGLDYVRVVDRNGSASEVPVQLSPLPDPAQVEVLSGLADGDVIVAPGR
jgi:RND family efflux transporter MFP subunit